jgi:hypothetical protein
MNEKMSEKTRDSWNRRSVQTTVSDLCDCCNTLQQAVQDRTNAYPFFKMKSCEKCFEDECTRREKDHPVFNPYDFCVFYF